MRSRGINKWWDGFRWLLREIGNRSYFHGMIISRVNVFMESWR